MTESGVTDLRLGLSLGAVQALAHGNELVFELPDEQMRVTLVLDSAAQDAFREHIHRALLALLPTSPTLN